ncbi:hypothetical protein DD592_26775 [Enterobacter cloacae complex sp. 2DZ2F20B]|nr:hypothetical protein DD592_26775 [Enterobacter cloacae complex sp. 2DZ2F20B]
MWKYVGIKSKEIVLKNFISNPADESKNLYFMADPSHIYKNIRFALVYNKIVIIPDEFVNKYALPSNEDFV